MTGDYTPDMMALLSADIIISTPEKWDGISRNWHSRSYVTKVHLFVVILFNGILFSFHFCTFYRYYNNELLDHMHISAS